MTTNIHIDLETYSEADLKKVGLYRYATDPSSEIQMMAWAVDHHEIDIVDTRDDMETILLDFLLDQRVIFWAHNAAFERIMLREVLGIDIPIERWRCTQVLGYSFAFAGGLGDMVKALDAPPEMQKDAIGTRLIHRFSKPQPKNHKVRRWTKENDPEGWAQFMEYCRQDVVAERWLHERLSPYTQDASAWELYALDQKINDRGLPIDMKLMDAALTMADKEKDRLLKSMQKITGLSNPGSNSQLKQWLIDRGLPMENMQKETLNQLFPTLPDGPARDVIELKLQHAKASTAKWAALDRANVDGKIHGAFQFGGASRTMRWAGRIFQPHNLPRPTIKEPEQAADIIAASELPYEVTQFCYPSVMEVLSSTLRGAVKAPKDAVLVVSDLSSIESRVLGWFTGCDRIQRIFATGKDTYKDMAVEIFSKPYDEITKAERTFAKPIVLGGGYYLGAKGLLAYADGFGIEMDLETAQKHVDTFRATYPEIPKFWEWIKQAVFLCTQTGASSEGYMLKVFAEGEFLRIRLPSGRCLSYHKPAIIEKAAPWSTPERVVMIDNFSFMGMNQFTKKWKRINVHPGFLTENITQAIARDVLCVWLRRSDARDFYLVLHVHDEEGAVEAAARAEERLAEMNQLIREPIPWAPGLLLDAEGYISRRYKK